MAAPDPRPQTGTHTGSERGAAAAQDDGAHDAAAQDSTGQDSTGQDSTGQDSTGEDSAAQDSTGQDSTGQDSTGQDSAGQDSAGQDDVRARFREALERKQAARHGSAAGPADTDHGPHSATGPARTQRQFRRKSG